VPTASSARSATGKSPREDHEDAKTLAFMDINPLTGATVSWPPRRTRPPSYDAEAEDLKAVMATAKKVAGAIGRRSIPTASISSRPMARRRFSRWDISICT